MMFFTKKKINTKQRLYSDEVLTNLVNEALKLTKESRTEVQLCQILENISIKNYKWIRPILDAIKNENNDKFNSKIAEIKEYNELRAE
jgi:hypothetical protein